MMIDQRIVQEKLALVVERLKNLQRPSAENEIAASKPDGGKSVGLFPRDFGFQAWDWPQGVGLYGLYNLHRATGDESIKRFLKDWYAGHFREGLPVRNINTTIPLLALSYLFEELPPEYGAACRDWAEWLIAGLPKTKENGFQHTTTADAAKGTINLNEGQLWIDTLFMTVLFLARMGRLTGDSRFSSRGDAAVPGTREVPLREADRPLLPRLVLPGERQFRRRLLVPGQFMVRRFGHRFVESWGRSWTREPGNSSSIPAGRRWTRWLRCRTGPGSGIPCSTIPRAISRPPAARASPTASSRESGSGSWTGDTRKPPKRRSAPSSG
jgi:hypothetical protein